MLLLFAINTPKTVNGLNVIDADPGAIPLVGGRSIITNGERNAILAGTASFEILTIEFDPEATNVELEAIVQALYDERVAVFQAEYQARWLFAGVRIDAT